MRRLLLSGLVLLAAVLLQVIVVNSLPLPGGAGPDLVLVAVVALAVTGGPLEGALAGFGAGLALDVAPPAVHLVGLDALAFCLVGYGAGRLAEALEGTAWLRLAAVAAATAAGEALQAALGLMFSQPDFAWPAVRQVLPAAIIYECLLSPFALAAVVSLRERVGALATSGTAMGGELAARTAAAAAPLAGLAGTTETVRSTGTGRSPRLRAAASRADGWIGSHPPPAGLARTRPAGQRSPSLRLRGGQAGSAAAIQVSRSLPVRPVNLRLGSRRRGDRLPGMATAAATLGDARAFLPGARPRVGSFRGGPSALSRTVPGLLPRARPRQGSFRGGPSAARQPAAGLRRRAQPRPGSLRGGPSAARAGASMFRAAQPRKGAFSGGPSAARAAGLLRGAQPRKGTFSGSPSAARASAPGLAGRPGRLRIGTRRSRDGVVGGSIGSMLGGRSGGLRAGRAAAPRFRSGGGLTGRGRRRGGFGGGLTGMLPGTRLPGRRLRLGRAGRRGRVWRIGSKRTGGLS